MSNALAGTLPGRRISGRLFRAGLAAGLAVACLGCCPKTGQKPAADTLETRARTCPERADAARILPSVTGKHLKASYWIQRLQGVADPDEVLLSTEAIDEYNAALGQRRNHADFSRQDLTGPVDREQLEIELKQRLDYLRELIGSGHYLDRQGKRLSDQESAGFDVDLHALVGDLRPELRVALDSIQILCGPFDGGLYKTDLDLTYDRNACSRVHPQEVVQVLREWPNGMRLLRTGYAVGWATSNLPLSPPVPADLREAFLNGERLRTTAPVQMTIGEGVSVSLERHLTVPVTPEGKVVLASKYGFHLQAPVEQMESTRRPLTRRALLNTAFEFQGLPFGWGGMKDGRDCSRFILDLFATFGISMPRHSSWQAQTGSYSVEVKQSVPEPERLELLDEAARNGVVLLHFPGHIMLYLGRDERGIPMVLHSLGEYVKPCAGGTGETLFLVQRITVSDLELGRGSSRRSFIERLTRIIVFGKRPEMETVQ